MLAGKLSRFDQSMLRMVSILIEAGADIQSKDAEKWTLSEVAREHKNISMYSILFDLRYRQRKDKWLEKRSFIMDKLKKIPDFYVELKWDLSSSFIPGMNKFLPSDIFKIWKFGTNIRLDFSFVGMRGMKQKRREITFLFRDG